MWLGLVLLKNSLIYVVDEFVYILPICCMLSIGYPKFVMAASNLVWSMDPNAFRKLIERVNVCVYVYIG